MALCTEIAATTSIYFNAYIRDIQPLKARPQAPTSSAGLNLLSSTLETLKSTIIYTDSATMGYFQ